VDLRARDGLVEAYLGGRIPTNDSDASKEPRRRCLPPHDPHRWTDHYERRAPVSACVAFFVRRVGIAEQISKNAIVGDVERTML